MKIGYIKSTIKYTAQEQLQILISAGCTKIYTEPSNNIDYKQIKLTKVLEILSVDDILVVTRLSILSNKLQNLLQILQHLEKRKVVLQVVEQDYLSTGTNSLNNILSHLSIFLEDARREKQAIGIYNAKEKGKRLGRPSKLSHLNIVKAMNLKKHHTSNQIANRFGVGKSTLLRNIAKYRKVS